MTGQASFPAHGVNLYFNTKSLFCKVFFLSAQLSPHLCSDHLQGLNQADQQLDGTGGVESRLGV